MKLEMISVLLSFLLLGCVGMSAFVITPTTTPTTKTSTPFPTPHWTDHPTVQITGDVYVRDDQGKVMGWLNKGDEAPAACSGDWCQIVSGRYRSYHFWRGCSSDNPERKSCQAR